MNELKKMVKIESEKVFIGIELGSTRIKSVLVNKNCEILSVGNYEWENRLKNEIWTYDLEDVWKGIQSCYSQMATEFREKYQVPLTTVGAIGVSAMMHGYLAFDKNGRQLAEFRTWRNNITAESADFLTEQFNFRA